MNETPERNFSARVAYDGTAYAGFQLQPNDPTIQGELESALAKVSGASVRVHGASRTDAGVHAVGQVVSFSVATMLPTGELERALNAQLNDDIRIGPVLERHDDFHARFSAKGKRYAYRIYRGERESPFLARYSHWVWGELDGGAMREAALLFIGERDFRSFSPRLYEGEEPVKTIGSVEIVEDGDLLEFVIEGSGFMYHMARAISGGILETGQGGIAVDVVGGWLKQPELGACRYVLPARGLFLMDVFY